MVDQEDKEYLTECLKHTSNLLTAWYISDDTVITVARILAGTGHLRTPELTIDFFEKPSKWERVMKELVEEKE